MRLVRMESGVLGDVKSVVRARSEARIDYGPGYRLYFTQRGPVIILLALRRRQVATGAGHQASKATCEGMEGTRMGLITKPFDAAKYLDSGRVDRGVSGCRVRRRRPRFHRTLRGRRGASAQHEPVGPRCRHEPVGALQGAERRGESRIRFHHEDPRRARREAFSQTRH